MSQQLIKLAVAAEQRKEGRLYARLAAYSEKLLLFYLNQVPCIFQYRLANTPANRRRKRVGKMSGYRQGVRNLNYVPDTQHPAAPQKSGTTRYYDLGRQSWRAWAPGLVVSVTAFWSEEGQAFVDTPELAGIVKGKPFSSKPATKPELNPGRAARTAKRQAAREQKEKIRNQNRLRPR